MKLLLSIFSISALGFGVPTFGTGDSSQNLACHLKKDMVNLGFISARAPPVCDPQNEVLYLEKQCFDAPIGKGKGKRMGEET